MDTLVPVIAGLRARHVIDLRRGANRRRISVRERLVEAWGDWSRHVNTGGFIRADAFGVSPSRIYAYTPTPWRVARELLDSLEISPDDVFLDCGCGKGRMLVAALHYPFRRVVGIEIIPSLAAAARRNLSRLRGSWEVIEADASIVPLPDDATVIYAFNPFGPEVLPQVFTQIRESLMRRPRSVTLLTYGIRADSLSAFGSEGSICSSNDHLRSYKLGPGRWP